MNSLYDGDIVAREMISLKGPRSKRIPPLPVIRYFFTNSINMKKEIKLCGRVHIRPCSFLGYSLYSL